MKIPKKVHIAYESFMAILALIAVILAISDMLGKIPEPYYHACSAADNLILIIFICDYGYRILRAENKKKFFQENIFDLLALIPFSSFFRVLRAARLFRLLKVVRLLRVAVFFNRFNHTAASFLATNGFLYVLYATLVSLITGATIMYLLSGEAAIKTYSDALWWAFVTATTVGYGDISPSTLLGRGIAAVLMIVGIGFISMLTGTIATYFMEKAVPQQEQSSRNQVIDLSDMTNEEFCNIRSYVDFVRSEKNTKK